MSTPAPGGASGHAAPPPPGGSGCVALDHGRFLRLRGATGTTVTGVSGLLWLTRDGAWDDVLLMPGEPFRVPDDVPVLVSAFGPSVARVVVPARRCRRLRPTGARARAAGCRLAPARRGGLRLRCPAARRGAGIGAFTAPIKAQLKPEDLAAAA